MANYVKQTIISPQQISANMKAKKRLKVVIMSFDKDVHEIVVPIIPQANASFEMDEIQHVLVFFKTSAGGLKQYNGTVQKADETVSFVIPDEFNRYRGSFDIELDLELTSGRNLTVAQFSAEAKESYADTTPSEIVDETKEYYFEMWVDFQAAMEDKRDEVSDAMDKAKTQAVTDVNAKVANVESTKTQANKDIKADVDAVEATKTQANKDIAAKVTAVETTLDAKVAEVETTKKQEIAKIKQALPDVNAELADVKKQLAELDTDYADKRIYGIKIDHTKTSDNVTRLEDAAGMVANVASDTSGEVRNDFDKIYPWKNEFTKDVYGNEFRKIRLFYIKYVHTDNWSKFYVSMTKHDDTWFALPCFTDYSKTTKDAQGRDKYALLPYAEIGRYLGSLSSDGKLESKPNVFAKRWLNRVTSRNYATANNDSSKKLAGYQIEDQSTLFMLQVLFMVEFATTDSQSIMQGETALTTGASKAVIAESSSNRIVVQKGDAANQLATLGATLYISTNTDPNNQASVKVMDRQITKIEECDATGKPTSGGDYWSIVFGGEPVDIVVGDNAFNATHKTGYSNLIEGSSGFIVPNNSKTPMMYRGIEALWGSIWRWLDGLNMNGYEMWICDDSTKFADNKFTGPDYAKLAYNLPAAGNTEIKLMGYDSEHPWGMLPIETGNGSYNDNIWTNSSGQFGARSGGPWTYGSSAGLFFSDLLSSPSYVNYLYGCRLVHKAL